MMFIKGHRGFDHAREGKALVLRMNRKTSVIKWCKFLSKRNREGDKLEVIQVTRSVG